MACSVAGSGIFAADRRLDELELVGSEGLIHFSMFADELIQMLRGETQVVLETDNPRQIQSYHAANMAQHLAGASLHPALGIENAKTDRIIDAILAR